MISPLCCSKRLFRTLGLADLEIESCYCLSFDFVLCPLFDSKLTRARGACALTQDSIWLHKCLEERPAARGGGHEACTNHGGTHAG